MAARIHQEIVFEDEICKHLSAHGWLFHGPLPYVKGFAYDEGYDKRYAVFPEDSIAWVKKTQPEAWKKFTAHHKDEAHAQSEFTKRLVEELDKERKTIRKDDPQLWGSLHVLRRGFKHINATFKMAQFAPANKLNPKLWEDYQSNILRVVRQVHYSMHNGNCIDLVLFINGIPVATVELKTETTQSIDAAVRQYRKDRPPIDPSSNAEEPLLSFGKRALVHFALSSDEVRMSTKLAGEKTFFLPFNKGIPDGLGGASAGNPADAARGHATAYFWHETLEPKTFLDILGKFISVEVKEVENPKTNKNTFNSTLLFPRYHQLNAVNKLLAETLAEGVGHSYLIMHSPGSGKSNTIGWSAHRLSNLFDENDEKLFTTVIVITDRKVLDQQLQDTIKQFEATPGVVVKIDENSTQLAEALDGEAKIVVTTIQKFPFILSKIGSMKKRRFAVIIDEAHSSQSGKTAVQLREALTKDTAVEDWQEEDEVSSEELIAKLIASRKRPPNVSYYAFTATPKTKTLEIFGRPDAEGRPEPFDVYSMRQAIEEKFIIDVLKGYTTYDMAFKLEQEGGDIEVKAGKATKRIFQYVQLHPTSIGQKISVIVEHFRTHVMHMLGGQAKAMVVTDSRKAAVRYKIEFDKYMQRMGYQDFKALVAYSGTITDPEYGIDNADEGDMNGGQPKIKDDRIKESFVTDEYRVLLVANKFQVGFDEPRLCAMYVDKRLDGVMAVQTLSRLNRIFPGKEKTCVIDFRNKPEDILNAFMPYYRTATLAASTDRNLPHQLREKLDAAHVYLWEEVEAFAKLFFSTRNDQAFQAHLKQAYERFDALEKEEQDLFRGDARSFVSTYDFLSQLVDYDDPDLEKLHAFLKMLLPRLSGHEPPLVLDGAIRLAGYKLVNKREAELDLNKGEALPLMPIGPGGGEPHEDPEKKLSEIITKIHSLFTGKHSDPEVDGWFTSVVGNTVLSEQVVMEANANPTLEQFANGSVKSILLAAVKNSLLSHESMAGQVLQDSKVFEQLAEVLIPEIFARARAKADVSRLEGRL